MFHDLAFGKMFLHSYNKRGFSPLFCCKIKVMILMFNFSLFISRILMMSMIKLNEDFKIKLNTFEVYMMLCICFIYVHDTFDYFTVVRLNFNK